MSIQTIADISLDKSNTSYNIRCNQLMVDGQVTLSNSITIPNDSLNPNVLDDSGSTNALLLVDNAGNKAFSTTFRSQTANLNIGYVNDIFVISPSCTLERISNLVVISIPSFRHTVAIAGGNLVISNIPAAFLPASQIDAPVWILENGTYVSKTAEVGIISITIGPFVAGDLGFSTGNGQIIYSIA